MKTSTTTLTFLLILSLYSCKKEHKNTPISLFKTEKELSKVYSDFDKNSIGVIEGLLSNDSSLVILDFHSGNSFSLFNLSTEKSIGRFGTIGQGPGEIPLGCYGYLSKNYFYASYDHTGLIAQYNMDSLIHNINVLPLVLIRYKIPEAFFSRVISINDSLFLGAGSYKSKYQFALFNSESTVVDYNIEIYNSKNEEYNMYHKFLSNQGILRKHPSKNKFIYALNYSSNIDFIEIINNKIYSIKSLRFRNPKGFPQSDGELNRILPDTESPIGYIDVAVGNNYIYAIYTDKKMIKENGKGNTFSSKHILVFDWEGNPINKYHLEDEAYFITVNEKSNKMYIATKAEDDGWCIETYTLNK